MMGIFDWGKQSSGKVSPTSAPHTKQKQVRLCIVLTGDDNWVTFTSDYSSTISLKDHFKNFFGWLENESTGNVVTLTSDDAFYAMKRDKILYAFAEIVE